MPAPFAATTLALIHFALASGATVELSYAPAYISEAQAIRTGVPMAQTMWKDFCGSKGSRCDAGQYYKINLDLLVAKGLEKEAFSSCQGFISYTRRGAAKFANFEPWGFYNCESSADNPTPRVVRTQVGAPVMVAQPEAAVAPK